MKIPNQKVIVCGIREIKRTDKPTLIFLDFYCDGAKQQFLNENDLQKWTHYVGKTITTTIEIGEYKQQATYKIELPSKVDVPA